MCPVDRRTSRLRSLHAGALLLASCLAWAAPASADDSEPLLESLTLVVPSVEGGGFDLTAQAIRETLIAEKLVGRTEVVYSPGAGGLIGLAHFAGAYRGRGDALLVGGSFMFGAAAAMRSAVSPTDLTPIARLTADVDAVVVPLDSPLRTIDDLIEAQRASPNVVAWVGGSAGGPDQFLTWSIAGAGGIPASQVRYTALPGGSAVGKALAEGKFTVGVSGYSELAPLLDRGVLRPLAITGASRLQALPAVPTLSEKGVRVTVVNWRGAFAPPGLDSASHARLVELIDRMVASPRWSSSLRHNHWRDEYLQGESFGRFVSDEHERAESAAAQTDLEPSDATSQDLARFLARRHQWAFALGALALLLGVILSRTVWRRRQAEDQLEVLAKATRVAAQEEAILQLQVAAAAEQARRHALHEAQLREALDRAATEARNRAAELENALNGIAALIGREFARWDLSSAEREIAMLMLKGMSLKQIARMRETSERTVRQQAQAIYRKAGIEGRHDLSAHFLEDLLKPAEQPQPVPTQS